MKIKTNKIYIWLLIVALVVTTALSGVNPMKVNVFSNSKKEINIYVEKPDNWKNIWIWYDSDLSTYAWDTTSLAQSPGDLQEYRSGWYKKTIESSEVQFLFNDGSWNNKLTNDGNDFKTTNDIWIQKNGQVSYTDPVQIETPEPTDDSVHLYYYSEGESPNIYYWNAQPGSLSNNWPGDKMNKYDKKDNWYEFELKNTSSTNLIFNMNGSNQTSDLSQVKGDWCYINGKWVEGKPEEFTNNSIKLHFKSTEGAANVHYYNGIPGNKSNAKAGEAMKVDGNDWYSYEIKSCDKATFKFIINGKDAIEETTKECGEWWYKDGEWYKKCPESTNKITVHYYSTLGQPSLHYWDTKPEVKSNNNFGEEMTFEKKVDGGNVYKYVIKNVDSAKLQIFNGTKPLTIELDRGYGEWWYKEGTWYSYDPFLKPIERSDFRDESIYFVMTSRFYDGDSSNNVHCWDDANAKNPDSDPAWRGDFKGLIEKLKH